MILIMVDLLYEIITLQMSQSYSVSVLALVIGSHTLPTHPPRDILSLIVFLIVHFSLLDRK